MSRTRPPRARRALTPAAGLAALALLTACSSPTETPSGDDELTPLTMQSAWINDAEFMGYFIGLEEGYYEELGIDLEYLPGGPAVIPESTLLSGDADLALTTPDTTIAAITDQGTDFVILGAQYQQNPLGIVSLVESGITGPADLVGKTVAVPDVNRLSFSAVLAINGIDEADVTVVPYAYDPTPLISGEVDATIDFVTNVPYTIGEQGYESTFFTLYDAGFRIPNNTVVVFRETLEEKRDALKSWLEASTRGWEENFTDPDGWPEVFMDNWFAGTGRTLENEIYFNNAQQPLMESPNGFYYLDEDAIQDIIDSLALIGIEATTDMFDLSLFD